MRKSIFKWPAVYLKPVLVGSEFLAGRMKTRAQLTRGWYDRMHCYLPAETELTVELDQ
jgi:hypothetical protein